MDELDDLAEEQRAFADLLGSLGEADWRRASASAGWTIRDQVSHLADTEEVAADTILAGPRTFGTSVAEYATAEEFTAAGCRRGDGMSAEELVMWWAQASMRTRELLVGMPSDERVPWGFGMSANTFAVARLMEHWAHGLDIADALGIRVAETPRLRRVAGLGLATLRYALAMAGRTWPTGRTLRLELTEHDGVVYRLGAEDATDVLRGPLMQWCRVATQRAHRASGLQADGPLAVLATSHARAYL